MVIPSNPTEGVRLPTRSSGRRWPGWRRLEEGDQRGRPRESGWALNTKNRTQAANLMGGEVGGRTREAHRIEVKAEQVGVEGRSGVRDREGPL